MSLPAVPTLRRALRALLARCVLVVGVLGQFAASAPTAEGTSLRPTFGGVLLEARLLPQGSAALTGVWSDVGQARLMRCSPRCAVVKEIALSGPVALSQSSMFRVVLGGTFRPGQRVRLLLRFGQSSFVTVDARVTVN